MYAAAFAFVAPGVGFNSARFGTASRAEAWIVEARPLPLYRVRDTF